MIDPPPEKLLRIAKRKAAKYRVAVRALSDAFVAAQSAAEAYANAVACRGTNRWWKAYNEACA